MRKPITPPPEPEPAHLPTVRYPSQLPSVLQNIGRSEFEAEKLRLEKRKKRKEAKEKESIDDTTPTESGVNGIATPEKSKPSTPAPVPEVKLTKKQREKDASNQTNEALQRSANETAAMQLGGFGAKYSWMNAASAAKPVGGIVAGAGMREKLAGSRKPSTSAAKPAQQQEDVGLESKHSYKQLGLLKEPPGVILQDYVSVLEHDGKQKKSLMRGYTRLGSEKSTT
jgi:hypothetical protein